MRARARAFVRRHPLRSFVVLAYGVSWLAWLPLLVGHARVVPGGRVTHFPGLLGPAAAAFVITALTDGGEGARALARRMVRVSKPALRFLACSASPLGFLLLALLLARLAGGPVPGVRDFALYSGLPAWPVPVVLLLVVLCSGYGEEVGWRGFALERLQARFGPVRGTLALAVIWAGWHLPAFGFVEGYRSMGPALLIGGFGLGIAAGSVVLARVANRTGGSVLAAALWHAAYNLTSATAGGRGLVGAVTTACVMLWAGWLLLGEWRSAGAPSRLAVAGA